MTKEIKLTKGKAALVDDDIYGDLAQHKWCVVQRENHWYAYRRNKQRKVVMMHRYIVNCPDGMYVDHINGNGLDNRQSNLRVCTLSQNLGNAKISSRNTTGFKGVSYKKYNGKFTAHFRKEYLGVYDTPEAAALAYNEAAQKYYGEFAQINSVNAASTKSRIYRSNHYERHATP